MSGCNDYAISPDVTVTMDGGEVCPDCLTKNRRLADGSVKGGDE